MSINILIIDENKQDQETIKSSLKEEDYSEVSTADSGQKGLVLVKKSMPDIIFMNVHLPKEDSFQICQEIKQLNGSEVRIIMMTDNIDAIDASKARFSGADDYCVKTFDCLHLLEGLKRVL